MTHHVWTEATRDAIDAVTVTAALVFDPPLVVVEMTSSGANPRRDLSPEAARHLTPTAARVLAHHLTAAADLIENGPNPLAQLRDILWPPEDVDADWDSETLEVVADALTRAGYGRPA